jgi:hypothetical protein
MLARLEPAFDGPVILFKDIAPGTAPGDAGNSPPERAMAGEYAACSSSPYSFKSTTRMRQPPMLTRDTRRTI